MQQVKDLIPKLRKKLSSKQWYHQRFDGSPMFLFPIAEAETKREKRKPAGTEAMVRVCFFESGKADWYLAMQDIKRGADKIIQLAKKNHGIPAELLDAWQKDEQKFEHFFWREFPKINLKKLSDQELIEFWNRSYYLFINRVTSSSIIDHFALGTDELISQLLRRQVGKLEKESQFTQIFSIATAPIHQSFINQAEIDLLEIALGKSKEKLSNYQKRYFWTRNNYYLAQELDIKHFQEEINAWKFSKKDLGKELKRIKDVPRANKLNKQQLFKKYCFSSFLKTLIKISEDFTWWQDERKKSTYFNIHIGLNILNEIVRRKHYQLDELKYAFPPEIEKIVFEKKPTQKELQIRRKGCVMIVTEKAFEVRAGRELSKIKKMILDNKSLADIQDFRGLSASTGKAVGPVKIVKSATEVGKVNEGDILVAVMTRPDYIVAMKKAAAIVTNEGGITSHAAIVSREFGIPCIIGTKIATEVLKDGDLVEVNANHGWVRKIK